MKFVLESAIHKKLPVVKIRFPYPSDGVTLIKQYPESRWSASMKSWYVKDDRILLRHIYEDLIGLGHEVDASGVSRPSSISPYNVVICERYRSYLEGLRFRESTIATYFTFIKALAEFLGDKKMDACETQDFRSFIEFKVKQLNFSISTHRQLISALRHLTALFPELIIPVEGVQRPKRSQFRPEVLSVEEVIKLLQVTHNLKHRFILAMLYSCGLRINELLTMPLNAIDLERKQVLVKNGKGRKDRYVMIAHHIYPLLTNYLNSFSPTEYLITGSNDRPYSASSVRAFLKRSCRSAGITKKVTPHTLRHSYATHLLENGVGLRHIQELLGHRKPETTMLYTHIARKDLLKIENPLDVAVEKYRTDKRNSNMSLSG
jgi:site-specific recombinase XerD